MAATDDTWVQFIFEDAMAYIPLFIAIQSGNWDLRVASIKAMAPLFTVFDHPTYQILISRHLEDVLVMPAPIRAMFSQGTFVVCIVGRPWHSLAIEESHEMLINKDCKTATTQHIRYRSKAVKTLKKELFSNTTQTLKNLTSSVSTTPHDIKCDKNTKAQVKG